MAINSKLEEIRASGHLPSPRGAALQVIQLTHKDDVTNQEIAHAIKADPALSSRIIKVANALVAYQTRPIASIVDAVTVLGLNTVRQLVLSLSVMDSSRHGACQQFDYQDFWAHSLLTAITAQNLVLHSGIGSTEEVFILGLLGQIGSLALATARPQEYARILGAVAANADAGLVNLERAEFGFDHNRLTQAMMEDWGMPRVFQEVALHHEDPGQSSFEEGGRDWRLLNVLHVADYFSRVCLAQGPRRRKMVPGLILIATRMGVELDALTRLGDKSVHEWHEWCKLCGIRSVEVPPFARLLEAVPLAPEMLDTGDGLSGGIGASYKLRILLVDDDRAVLLLLKTLLENAGHTVVTARNGVEALSLVEKSAPQLVITDWIMPKMDGLEFCKAIRRNPAWRNIYVFIMTAQEGTDRLVEAFEAGANDYMTKPVNPKVLGARLRAGQRVVQLQEDMESDRQHLHKFADELAAFNHRLRKSDVSMRAIMDNSPYMAWLKDTEGRYIKVNKTYVDYARQKDVQQIIGKTDFDLWPKELAEKYRASDAEVMASRQRKHIEEPSLDGGKVHWVETFKTPVIDENGHVLGTTGFARDITERKNAEDRIAESERRFRAVAQSANDAIITIAGADNVVGWNSAAERMFGYTGAEIMRQPLATLIPERFRKLHSEGLARVVAGGAPHIIGKTVEFAGLRKDGGEFPLELSLAQWQTAEGKFFTAIIRDITERNKHEEELRRSNAELEQFSYAVSHDMRQPLRMISSYLQLLEMSLAGQLDDKKRGYFGSAIEGAKRIDQMLVALLDYSRVGRMGEAPTWIESRAALDEALQFLQPALDEAHVKLSITGEWPRILVSHDEVLRLLQNLIGNAAKFRIAGRMPEITVSSEAVKNEWCLCVTDNGVGIIPDQIKRLFHVFQRLQLRTAYEGTGIGLALCRKIAEHHKGRIWAESAGEGKGSKFCVVLPVLREDTLSAKGMAT